MCDILAYMLERWYVLDRYDCSSLGTDATWRNALENNYDDIVALLCRYHILPPTHPNTFNLESDLVAHAYNSPQILEIMWRHDYLSKMTCYELYALAVANNEPERMKHCVETYKVDPYRVGGYNDVGCEGANVVLALILWRFIAATNVQDEKGRHLYYLAAIRFMNQNPQCSTVGIKPHVLAAFTAYDTMQLRRHVAVDSPC
jgi:hypothetical protein